MDGEFKSQLKESSVFCPVKNRFASVLKPLGGFLCQDGQKNRKRTDIELAIIHRVCSPRLSLYAWMMHIPLPYYYSLFEPQPSDTVKEDTEEDTEEDIIQSENLAFFQSGLIVIPAEVIAQYSEVSDLLLDLRSLCQKFELSFCQK
jgi:hypothetical protein